SVNETLTKKSRRSGALDRNSSGDFGNVTQLGNPAARLKIKRIRQRRMASRRLHRSVAAVDEQQGAGHVGGIVRSEKQDAGADFIGRAVAPEQGALGGVVAVLVER